MRSSHCEQWSFGELSLRSVVAVFSGRFLFADQRDSFMCRNVAVVVFILPSQRNSFAIGVGCISVLRLLMPLHGICCFEFSFRRKTVPTRRTKRKLSTVYKASAKSVDHDNGWLQVSSV